MATNKLIDLGLLTKYDELIKDFVDKKTVNGKKLENAVVLDGRDIKLDNYTKAPEASPVGVNDTVNLALGKLEKKVDDAVAGGVTSITAGTAITVDATSKNTPTVSVNVTTGNGLSVTDNKIILDQATTSAHGATKLDNTLSASDTTAATPKLVKDAIEALDSDATSSDGKYVTVKVTEDDGKLTAVNVTEKVKEVAQATAAQEGLADAYDVKTYVNNTITSLAVDAVTFDADETVASISETDGKISVTKKDIAITHTQVTDWDTNIGVKSVAANDASVTVTDGETQNPKVAVNINANDKVLSVDNGLKTTLAIYYNSNDRKLQLLGKDDAVISEFDASDFVKDGMLWGETAFLASAEIQTVSITKNEVTQTHEFTNLTAGHTYIAFCFTDGAATPTYTWEKIDISALITPYTAGNGIDITNLKISADVVAANGLSVDSEGIKMAAGTTSVVGAVKLSDTIVDDNTTAATPGAVRGAINALNATVNSSGSTYVTVTGEETAGKLTSITVTEDIQTVASASSSDKGLAEASDVKSYVDGLKVNNVAQSNRNITLTTENIKLVDDIEYDDVTKIPQETSTQDALQYLVTTIGDNEKVTSEALNELREDVGNLTSLETTDNSNLVAAINEVKSNSESAISELNVDNNISDEVAGVRVTVNESAGKVQKPVVAVSDNAVSYTPSADNENANLTVANTENVLKGNAIGAIKSYVDDKTTFATEDDINALFGITSA